MFVLYLNMMRDSKIEYARAVARAESPEALLDLMQRERLPTPVRDGEGYLHFYREEGPLYWFNEPLVSFPQHGIHDVGTEDDWAEEGRARHRRLMQELPVAEFAPSGTRG